MNSIEMSDVDGDALSFISRDRRTWITCTSGPDEVTVGPFPTHLVRGAFAPKIAASGEVNATLIGSAAPAQPPSAATPAARERAWKTFARLAEKGSVREALDGALDAAFDSSEQPRESEELADVLRHISLDDADALADHLVSLGYRRA